MEENSLKNELISAIMELTYEQQVHLLEVYKEMGFCNGQGNREE